MRSSRKENKEELELLRLDAIRARIDLYKTLLVEEENISEEWLRKNLLGEGLENLIENN